MSCRANPRHVARLCVCVCMCACVCVVCSCVALLCAASCRAKSCCVVNGLVRLRYVELRGGVLS